MSHAERPAANTDEQRADTLLREIVAGAELAELAGMLEFSGWRIDIHTFPGTLSASKGNGRVFYPGGVGGRWDSVISEMRPADGLTRAGVAADLDSEVVAWQVCCTLATPLDRLVSIAELSATGAPSSPVEDFFQIDWPDGEDNLGTT